MSTDLPELISKFDQVLEQVFILVKDIEAGKMDSGVVVMANDGRVDVRGLGVADTPAKAVALLFMAMRSFDNVTQADVAAAAKELMERSEAVQKEVHLWYTESKSASIPPHA